MRKSLFSFIIPRFLRVSVIVILFFSFASISISEELPSHGPRPLMRFPDIDKDLIVFVYGEDIWSVPAKGGIAIRLTIHDGAERFPKISPDGSLIAFTGEYDGNADVYVMDVYGGGLSAPDYWIYDTNGEWIVENEGVVPDIIVDLHPEEVARGYDAQLMKAVEVLMQKIEEEPRPWPEHKPFLRHKRKRSN